MINIQEHKEKLKTRSYQLALKIIYVHKNITLNYHETLLSGKFLDHGTQVGEFLVEALDTPVSMDVNYLLIKAYQALSKTEYWLRLLHESAYIDQEGLDGLDGEIQSLRKNIQELLQTPSK